MRYDRQLFFLLLLTALSSPLNALELQRLAPTTGAAGSEVHLLGVGFGASAGDLSVVIQRRGESRRVRMVVTRWSDRDILVRVPEGVTTGIYEISLVSTPTRLPPVQSRSQPLSVLPRINREYDAADQKPEDQPAPTLHLRPELLPSQRTQGFETTPGVRLHPSLTTPDPKRFSPSTDLTLRPGFSPTDRAQGATADPDLRLAPGVTTPGNPAGVAGGEQGCADPALVGMKILHSQRSLDGSYQFQLRVQIRNLGSFPLQVDRSQTRLTLRQGAHQLYTATWSSPRMANILLQPGRVWTEEITVRNFSIKQAAAGLLAEISVSKPTGVDERQLDCGISNNRQGIDGSTLQRSLGILR
jgi:hypothetical protein